MPRIAVAGFQHETNTFAPDPTGIDIFRAGGAWPALTRGEAMRATFAGLNIPIAGFLGAARDWDIVPTLWANAEPGGRVTREAFDLIAGEICASVAAAGALDGVYLDLHGAMVPEGHDDGEAELLRRLRAVTGPDLPVVVSLDLHGNLSREFFDLASATVIYRTYPHVDMAATGARARALMADLLARGAPFARAFRQGGCIVPITAQSTRRPAGAKLYGLLPELEGRGVRSVDFAFGFPPADIPDCGPSIVAYGADQAAVDAAADAMLAALEAAEAGFADPLIPASEAVARAVAIARTASRPVVICDPQDNPGAGASGDSTGLLAELIAQDAAGAALGILWDPETARAAHAAGHGAAFDATIGGRHPETGGPALNVRVRVEALSDGAFRFTGPMYGNAVAHLGPCARLRVLSGSEGVQVIVGSRRAQNADRAMFGHIGVDTATASILCVKSAVHFLADYEPIAEEVIFAEAPGANPCRIGAIPYTRLRAGVRLGPGGKPFPGVTGGRSA